MKGRIWISLLLQTLVVGAFAQPVVIDPGFEQAAIPTNGFQYRPPGTGWLMERDAGVADGIGSWGTSAAEGSQYAFLQAASNGCRVSQSVSGFVPGQEYQVEFKMARRNGGLGADLWADVTLFVAGIRCYYMPTRRHATWRTYRSVPFIATSTSMPLVFETVTGPDRATLLDGVAVIATVPTTPPQIANPGFEDLPLDSTEWIYGPYEARTGWTFDEQQQVSRGSGLASGSTPWGSAAYEGSQYAFVQRDGSLSQTLRHLVPGSPYVLTFRSAFRAATGGNSLAARLDGSPIYGPYQAPSTNWGPQVTDVFFPTSDTAQFSIFGIDNGQDRATILDGFEVQLLDRIVTGIVNLEDRVTFPDVDISVTMIQGQMTSRTRAIWGNASVHFYCPFSGSVLVRFKASHWISRSVVLNIPAGGYSGFSVSLPNGDCDGDNDIDIGDYAVLSAHYGTAIGDPGYRVNADLDGDGEVAIGDYSILSRNYGRSGS